MNALSPLPTATAPPTREYVYTAKDFAFLQQKAKDYAGIVLAAHKQDMVYSRIVRRVRALGLPSFEAYCQFLGQDDPEEIGHFVNAITTNLTHFFREKHHFDHLGKCLQRWQQVRKPGRLRIWSAGCSAGMEPYSIALTCLQTMPQIAQWDVKILATDIDSNILQRAAVGRYEAKEVEAVAPAQLKQYFSSEMQGEQRYYTALPALKQLIHFKPLNLFHAWPMQGMFDVIFCRNVMIYFDHPTQEQLLQRFAAKLVPGGMLYIGHSEQLHGVDGLFSSAGMTSFQKQEG